MSIAMFRTKAFTLAYQIKANSDLTFAEALLAAWISYRFSKLTKLNTTSGCYFDQKTGYRFKAQINTNYRKIEIFGFDIAFTNDLEMIVCSEDDQAVIKAVEPYKLQPQTAIVTQKMIDNRIRTEAFWAAQRRNTAFA